MRWWGWGRTFCYYQYRDQKPVRARDLVYHPINLMSKFTGLRHESHLLIIFMYLLNIEYLEPFQYIIKFMSYGLLLLHPFDES